MAKSRIAKHDEAIEAACQAYGSLVEPRMRRAIAAFNKRLSVGLTSGPIGIGDIDYAARLDETADELEQP